EGVDVMSTAVFSTGSTMTDTAVSRAESEKVYSAATDPRVPAAMRMTTTTTRIMTRGAGRGARRTVMLERSWTWQDQAACREEPIELFFGPEGEKPPQRDERERRAPEVCASCPVREACQSHAVGLPETYGVWGGTTESTRLAIKRRRVPSPAA